MTLIRSAITSPVKVAVGVMLLTLFGTLSIFQIPVQLTPNVDKPMVTVMTLWPGASPQEIEREIVERQEEKLKSVANLRSMTSTSVEGEATVALEFYVGANIDTALRDVSDKLRQVTGYPEEAEEPTAEAANAALNTPIAWLIFYADGGDDPTLLKDFVDDKIKPLLERAPGVASVDIYGGREREVQVRVDAARMAARGITFRELESALIRQNINISAGTISGGKRDDTWRTLGQFESIADVESTVIAHRPGGPVYVKDIAQVVSTHKKQYSFVHSLGQTVLALPVRRETGSNVIEVMEHLKKQIEVINRDLLKPLNRGYRLEQVYDETVYIHSSIDLVLTDLYLGGFLAVVVLAIFLRSVSATAIVSLSIPLSVLGSFLIVLALGRTVNVVMLAGMSFGIGSTIDNAIVIVENIYRHRQLGKDRLLAALDGTLEVWGAILANTLTALVVFIPVIFMQEEAGQLFRDIAIAISACNVFSLVICVTVVPTAAAKYLGRGLAIADDRPHGRIAHAIGSLVHWVNGRYASRLIVIALLSVGSIGGIYVLMTPTDYLPGGNRNLVFGFLFTPPGYSLDEFLRMGKVIEGEIASYWQAKPNSAEAQQLAERWLAEAVPPHQQAVQAAQTQVEQLEAQNPDDPKNKKQLHDAYDSLQLAKDTLKLYQVPPPLISNFFYVAWNGQCFMGAVSQEDQVVKPVVNLLSHVGGKIPGSIPVFFQASLFEDIGGSGNSIELQIRGDTLPEVTAVAEQLQMAIMARLGFPQPNPPNFNLGRPEIQITPDRVRAAEVGLNVRDVGQIIEACINGALVSGGFREKGEEVDLVIQVQGAAHQTKEQILQVPIHTPTGQIIPLTSIVQVTETTAPQQINHIEEMPAVTLTIRPPEEMALEQAMALLQDQIIAPMREKKQIPDTVFTQAAGNADKLVQTRRAMFGAWSGFNTKSLLSLLTSRGFIALLITYLLMAALFESYTYPFVIIFTVLPGTVGGFVGLQLVHLLSKINPVQPVQKLDVVTMLGFVILIGIVVNNATLIVHQALNNLSYGMNPRDAITESTRSRIRPIFMTAITGVVGMFPLVIMPGAGSELYRGLGGVMLGGLLVSTLFTLFLTPALLSLMIDLKSAFRRILVKI